MSQAETLLDSLTVDEPTAYTANPETEGHIIIGENRVITVPDELKRIGVQYDHNIETVTFDCPRYWDDNDLSTMEIRINYEREDKEKGTYIADNIRVDSKNSRLIHFDWLISSHVTAIKGKLAFQVCIKEIWYGDSEVNHWNSEINKEMYISESLDCNDVEPINVPAVIVRETVEETEETVIIEPHPGVTMSRVELTMVLKSKPMLDSILSRNMTEISYENMTSVGDGLFCSCNKLETVDLPNCTSIGAFSFAQCGALAAFNMPNCVSIGDHSFYLCGSLMTVDLPMCNSVGPFSFYLCRSLMIVNLPECTKLGDSSFSYCSKLTIVDLPKCTTLGISDFAYCSSLTSISLPSCTYIKSHGFNQCSALTTVDLPLCEYIGQATFVGCKSLTSITLPSLKTLGGSAFSINGGALEYIDLGPVTQIGEIEYPTANAVFWYLPLNTLILRNTETVCVLANRNSLNSTNISRGTGYIYVPSALVDAYKTDTNWSLYANQFRAIEDYPDICGS